MKRKTIPLRDGQGSGLLPMLNYVIGGPSSGPMTVKGIPVSVSVDIAPGLAKTLITGVSILSAGIVFASAIKLVR